MRDGHVRNSWHYPTPGAVPGRQVSAAVWRAFWIWTAFFWGGTVVCATLFYVGVLDFAMSARLGLYGTSIWLNAWLIPFVMPGAKRRDKSQ
ncbi:MAG: hypothetical protein AAFS10_25760, partial [Myxococcota bacterium]